MGTPDKAATANEITKNFSLQISSLSHSEYDSNVGVELEKNYELDVLSQFKANLNQVENLNKRLRFVLGEVEQLIQRS